MVEKEESKGPSTEVNRDTVNEEYIIQAKWIRKGEEFDIRVAKANVTSF